MRARYLLAALTLGGCSLYFGDHEHDAPADAGTHGQPPDAAIEIDAQGPQTSQVVARCEDGEIREVGESPYEPTQPGHGEGKLIGSCPGACQSDAVFCVDSACGNAIAALCTAPSSQGATCDLEGTPCTAGAQLACPQSTTCGYAEPGAQCACTDGAYACTQLTPVAAVQTAIVGKWVGTVTPPSFAQPYTVSLWIYPDGTYWAESLTTDPDIAFYYGGDGPFPDRVITILSASSTEGAWANIAIDFGSGTTGNPPNIGALSALTVDATHLRFTFYASWFDCGQPFAFELTRQ